jgi:hypothetical protein
MSGSTAATSSGKAHERHFPHEYTSLTCSFLFNDALRFHGTWLRCGAVVASWPYWHFVHHKFHSIWTWIQLNKPKEWPRSLGRIDTLFTTNSTRFELGFNSISQKTDLEAWWWYFVHHKFHSIWTGIQLDKPRDWPRSLGRGDTLFTTNSTRSELGFNSIS